MEVPTILCYASDMMQFLFQLNSKFKSNFKPKFLFGALAFLLAAHISLAPALSANLHYNLQSTVELPAENLSLDPPAETNPDNPPGTLPDDELETYDFPSQLIIKAINPGYTTADKLTNAGELIELQNLADTTTSLAGFSVQYTNGSGKSTILYTFPEGALMTGEFLLMRYVKSPDADQSELTYSASLAMTAGPLELVYEGEVIDSICWTGKNGCAPTFKSSAPTTLVRNMSTGDFEHLSIYDTHFSPSAPTFYAPELEPEDSDEQPTLPPQCRGLEFSEILTYYSDSASEQFIELYNQTSKTIHLDGCHIQYKNKLYPLSGTVSPSAYLAYYPDFSLTKNPTTNNTISLIDTDGESVDELVYSHGQKKSTSYAKFYDSNGAASWSITYSPTPGSTNISQAFRTCPVGKVINPVTGNCVNVAASVAAECPAGKYRNPLTGRCKNIDSSDSKTLKECAEGYERNPTTNRCRKITLPNNGAEYALVPTTASSGKSFVAIGIVILIVLLGVVYIALQFRHEATRAARKIRQRCHDILKNQFSRKIRRDRDKEA